MRKTLLMTAALFMVAACSPANNDSSTNKVELTGQTLSVEEQMNIWLEEDFNAGVKHYPQFLAQLGIKERTDEWNDPTREFELERLEESRLALAEFKYSFDRSELSENGQISYDLYIKNAEDAFARGQYHDYGYIFNQMRGA